MKRLPNAKPELIAPAGDLEKLKIAFQFGADAVYASTSKFSMRTREIGFDHETLGEGIEYAHSIGKLVYLTLNIFPHSTQIADCLEHANNTIALKPDAIIVADPGVFHYLKEHTDIPLHLSTQANTTNFLTANFWEKQGADRVVLAREMSLADIKKTSESSSIHLECFVHGSMCMAYSGRCQISNYLTGRDPNQGACVQACRFKYKFYGVQEDQRPDAVFPLYEDNSGTYIFNSKDLCMIDHIPELIEAGVDSFKIEGRLKSTFYVASVVRAYREAIDQFYADPKVYQQRANELLEEAKKFSNRGYTTGFFHHKPDKESNNYSTTRATSPYLYIGEIEESSEGRAQMKVRNHFQIEERMEIEIVSPEGVIIAQINELTKNNEMTKEVHPNDVVIFKLTKKVAIPSFVRTKTA